MKSSAAFAVGPRAERRRRAGGRRRPADGVLRDVTVRVDAGTAPVGPLHFQGSAKGEDLFDRLELEGTIDPKSGRLTLTKGDLTRLASPPTSARRLPAEYRPRFDDVGLTGGEADLTLNRLDYDPSAAITLRYDATARLRSGAWTCKKLPFPLNDVSAVVTAKDGRISIERAEGSNGKTTVRAEGKVDAGRPVDGPGGTRPAGQGARPGPGRPPESPDAPGVRRALGRLQAQGAGQPRGAGRPPFGRGGAGVWPWGRLPRRGDGVSPLPLPGGPRPAAP